MRSADLHRLSRTLREIALGASGEPGERPSFGEVAVVEDLATAGPSTVGQIALRTGVAQSLVSKVARSLGETGIVTSTPDERDARRRVLALAPGIRDRVLLPRGDRPVSGAIAAALPHLDAGGVRRVEEVLVELSVLVAPPRGDERRRAPDPGRSDAG